MKAEEIRRADGEPAQIAFDRVTARVRALFARGYSAKRPAERLRPGFFALESLPEKAGWRITVEPLPRDLEVFA